MSPASGVSLFAPKPVVAALPQVILQVKPGQRVQIRPGESVFMFLQDRPDAVRAIRSVAEKSRFIVAVSDLPPFQSPPRTQGHWV